MRSWATAMAFAGCYDLHLLVMDHHLTPGRSIDAELERRCSSTIVLPKDASRDDIAPWLPERIEIVHYFRLASYQLRNRIEPVMESSPDIWLDLDDVESVTQRRIAAVARANGDDLQVRQSEQASALAAERERAALFEVDCIAVCSHEDAQRLEMTGGAQIVVLPNTLLRQPQLAVNPVETPFTLLFLGSLQYYPNYDGLRWFTTQVWPLLRAVSPVALRLVLAGTGINRTRYGELFDDPDVELVRSPSDVLPLYARCHAVIVPLRAGGGTRIKAIEAFNLGRPVIGTRLGLEGLGVEPGRHALVADDADGFVDAILRLIETPDLRRSLVAEARNLFLERFDSERLVEVMEGWG